MSSRRQPELPLGGDGGRPGVGASLDRASPLEGTGAGHEPQGNRAVRRGAVGRGLGPAAGDVLRPGLQAGTTHTCDDKGCFIEEQHIRRECQDELIELWPGTSHAELPTLEDLERALGEHASSLSEDTKSELRQAQQLNE
jgi:hypothetical protein